MQGNNSTKLKEYTETERKGMDNKITRIKKTKDSNLCCIYIFENRSRQGSKKTKESYIGQKFLEYNLLESNLRLHRSITTQKHYET